MTYSCTSSSGTIRYHSHQMDNKFSNVDVICLKEFVKPEEKEEVIKAEEKDGDDEKGNGKLHCFRCHCEYESREEEVKYCVVEHNFDLFEGSRNGTSWYTGTLKCCGAFHKFHRHNDDNTSVPEYCFEGAHTSSPDEVKYNNRTIKPCGADECGEKFHELAVKAYEQQREEKQKAHAAATEKKKEEKAAKKARIDQLKSEGKRREARRLRADMLGLDFADEEFDSDVDPEGCEEFDYASDSSIVPPWIMDEELDPDEI